MSIAGVLMSIIGGGGCAERGQPDHEATSFRAGIEINPTELTDVGGVEFLRYITDSLGPNAIERISAVAAASDGYVAVADVASCSVRFVRLDGTRPRPSIGGCGEGPGQFSMVSGMGLRGDTLYAFDPNRQMIQVLDWSGHEIRRITLKQASAGTQSRFGWIGMLDTDQFILARSSSARGGNAGDEASNASQPILLLTSALSQQMSVQTSPLRVPRLAEDVQRASGLSLPIRGCAAVSEGRGTTRVIVTHRLATESVVLGDDLSPQKHFSAHQAWARPVSDSGFPGGWRWGIMATSAACGDALFAVGFRSFEGPDERTPDLHGYLEVRRYSGELVVAKEWEEPRKDLVAIGAPRALFGDTLITSTVDGAGWPRLAAWKIVPEQEPVKN